MSCIAPYGSWKSPISSELMTRSSIGLGELQLNDDALYWLEMRPAEKGRYAVVRLQEDDSYKDCLPEDANARTRVHEYGGGSYYATELGVFFTQFHDQQIYYAEENKREKITESEQSRFADFTYVKDSNVLISVMETHDPNQDEAENSLVSIDLSKLPATPQIIVSGADFYSNPRVSPDGTQLTWICWHHPNMPWDNSELWLADIDQQGCIQNQRKISGGQDESVFQPEWSPNGVLYFISDKSGWWNLYRYQNQQVQAVIEMAAEFGVAQWSFRETTYAFIDEQRIACTYSQDGKSHLAFIDTVNDSIQEIETEYTDIESIQANQNSIVFLAASPTRFPEIVRYDLQQKSIEIIKKASELTLTEDCISKPTAIQYPSTDQEMAYAFFYPPCNDAFQAENELPPLIVFSHGGPTGMARSGLKMVIQYFTSRGCAVVDVNYGGSSGYGRAYRQRLHKKWGIIDVEDCIHAAQYLADKQLVDRERLAIRGGSAGGFTTLAALTFHDVFKAGCSRYGVSDLEALAMETHKFESRYLDNLIGPYPENKKLYQQRSPIHSAEQLSCPVIFFQGMEDKIVLPNQAEMMVDKLRNKGIAVSYIAFEGEQHGFRQAENIRRALDGEFYFFSRVFGFTPADNLPPIEIMNQNTIQ